MRLTVKELAELANVTVKTLHHYHKLGLLIPCEINEAGYRYYGQKELERLQQILFFRELDFSLADIANALADDVDRVKVLSEQRTLLSDRMKRIERLIQTLDDSITHTSRGEVMAKEKMFVGLNQKEWQEALAEQSAYLKENYGFELTVEESAQVEQLNETAQEAIWFQSALIQALRDGMSYKDEKIKKLLSDHLVFLNEHGISMNEEDFLANARFMANDDFHRKMMETAQIGLAYYYLAAVEAYVTA